MTWLVVAAVVGLVAACSSSNDNGGASGASATKAEPALRDGVQFDTGSRPGLTVPHAPVAAQSGSSGAKGGLTGISYEAFERAQIKTAGISLHATSVGTVITQVEGVAATEQGFVDSENTRTDRKGAPLSSLLTIRVPVDRFETAVDEISRFGQLVSKKVTTQDVTGRVADVASRVKSAQDSIAQLRILYSHATKLSDIITLESELSSREADLEALQAQQRALTDQTSLSTITVQITRTPKSPAVTTAKNTDDESGFVGGIKQGWDALVATFGAVSHGLGAVLPLGLSLLAIAVLVWYALRRIPRHRVDTTG